MTSVQDSWYVRTSLITLCGGKIIKVNRDPKYRPHTCWMSNETRAFLQSIYMEEERKRANIAKAAKFKHSL